MKKSEIEKVINTWLQWQWEVGKTPTRIVLPKHLRKKLICSGVEDKQWLDAYDSSYFGLLHITWK